MTANDSIILDETSEREKQTTQYRPDFLKSTTPWVETFSKAAAGIAIALYATGFLTVSIYHSQFGFVGTNPFRPTVLAAGAWFLFLTAIPISIASQFRVDSWRKIAENAVNVWIGCVILSIAFGGLVFDYTTDSRALIHLPTWAWVATAVLVVALVTVPPLVKVPEWVLISVPVLLMLVYLVNPLASMFAHEFDPMCLALWYFGVSFAALAEFKLKRGGGAEWAKSIGVLLGTLLIFSQYVYPHLKASWGGGTPVNVTVYFSKDSVFSPNKPVRAKLIEEVDEGFYIIGPNESKAIFVPRSAVAMIYFSDKPADSPILQNKVH